jgi:signal transduction histidine kinase
VKAHSSLARRTVGYLVIAQFTAFFLAWAATLGLGLAGVERFTQSWDELAAYRTASLVVDSLKRGADGHIEIEPSSGLQAEVARIPKLKFAAFESKSKTPVDGSSPELVARLEKVIEVNSSHTHFVLPSDPETPALGFMGPARTPYGRFHIATYHATFRLEDLFHSMREDLLTYAAYFVFAVLLSGATAWFAVRQGLAPLRDAAAEVAKIELDSLSKPLLPTDVPVEVSPFVDAVNEALRRLDAWAIRQRRITANAAHELRTPLAVMRARLENAKASALASELLSDASQLRSIVEQMLVASRLFEGQVSMDQEVNLSNLTGGVVAGLLPLAMDCNRFLDFEANPPHAIIKGNQRAIECVLTNLLDNAIRAEPKNGTIFVEVNAEGLISIVDHGEGVSPGHTDMIFEPFWRKSEKLPGTGLGLAIAKEIVDTHGGKIWVEETPGGGATFKLVFPKVSDVGDAVA